MLVFLEFEMKEVKVGQNHVALVDDEDFDRVSEWTWYLHNHGGYAATTKYRVNRVRWLMHRLILNAPKGVEVDHINGNPLDNRKENLRLCERRENARNTRKHKADGEYKGIWKLPSGRWTAAITKNYKAESLGTYDSPIVAALAYDNACRERFGAFGKPNFSDEQFAALWSEHKQDILSPKSRKGSSKYVGVHWSEKDNAFVAQIWDPKAKRSFFAGQSKDEDSAAIARERKIIEGGLTAKRNFTDEQFAAFVGR